MDKFHILKKAYTELNLDFKFNDKNHLYIKKFDCGYFRNNLLITHDETIILPGCGYTTNSNSFIENKGLSNYEYCNIYELLLWYYYYTIKYKHVEHKNNNKCYFSRIPKYYKNIKTKTGLNIIKKILDEIIIKNNGVPSYFNKNILDKLIAIK